MSSNCCSTPYRLNLKLKNIRKNPMAKSLDINTLYKSLNNSIPTITNKLCVLKNKTRELGKSLNRIPIVYNNFNTRSVNYSYLSPNIKTSPNISSSDYNYSYVSPKPALKQYMGNNNNNLQYSMLNYDHGTNYKNNNSNSNIKLNYNYNSTNPIKKYYNRNYSAINISKNNYRNNFNNHIHNNMNNNECCASYRRRNDNNLNNINNHYNGFNKSSQIDTNKYELKFNKLNQQICEKDKIINKMQDLIDDTLEKLNQKNKENSLLQSELLKLKTKSNFNLNNNYPKNIYENKRYKNNSNYHYANEHIQKNRNKRKTYDINSQKNYCRSSYYNNTYNNNDEEKMENKWEEIRKLNKKMDNLLQRNGSNLEKNENIRKRKYYYAQ